MSNDEGKIIPNGTKSGFWVLSRYLDNSQYGFLKVSGPPPAPPAVANFIRRGGEKEIYGVSRPKMGRETPNPIRRSRLSKKAIDFEKAIQFPKIYKIIGKTGKD